MAKRQDQDGIRDAVKGVQGDIACPPTRNDQFAETLLCGPPDFRVSLQHRDRFDDRGHNDSRQRRVVAREKIEESLKVAKRMLRIAD